MHLPAVVVQILFALQLLVCLYGGYRIARRTGRPLVTWLVLGFLAAIAFPPVGAIIIFVLFLTVPPARGADTRTANEEPAASAAERSSDDGGDMRRQEAAR